MERLTQNRQNLKTEINIPFSFNYLGFIASSWPTQFEYLVTTLSPSVLDQCVKLGVQNNDKHILVDSFYLFALKEQIFGRWLFFLQMKFMQPTFYSLLGVGKTYLTYVCIYIYIYIYI